MTLFDGLPAAEESSRTVFSGNRLDRHGEARDADAAARAVAHAGARLYLFDADGSVLADGAGEESLLFSPSAAQALGLRPETLVLLGYAEEEPRLAGEIAGAPPQSLSATGLRALAVEGRTAPVHLSALAQARALLNWHASHRFCARCGAETTNVIGGYRRDCAACGGQHFPRTDPVAIMLVIDGSRCLMGRQPRFVPGMFSALAGFIEPGETIEEAVRREVFEEAGIRTGRVRYFASQPWPFPSSLMIGCFAEALTHEIAMDATELEDCRWFEAPEAAMMIERRHPDGLTVPPRLGIAHQLVEAFLASAAR